MAPKLDRRTFLRWGGSMVGLFAAGCFGSKTEQPKPAQKSESIDELLQNEPVEPVAPEEIELPGELYDIDLGDDFVPYPISEFDNMVFTVPEMKDYTLREDLQLRVRMSPVSYWDYANRGAGHRVNVNLKQMYLDMAKGKENKKFRKYGVLPVFSNIKKIADKLSKSDDDYEMKMNDVLDDIIKTLDHRIYYSTFVLNDDDRKPLTTIVAKELGILDKENNPDYGGAIDFLDKIDFKNKKIMGKLSSRQAFRLEVPEEYAPETGKMHIEIEVYKNEKDEKGKNITRKKRKPTIIVYQVNGDEKKELMRTRTVVGGWNKDHDECMTNPLAPGKPVPKGWFLSGEEDDGIRYIKKCTDREFKTPSSDNLFMYHLVIGPSWLPLEWADTRDVVATRREVAPGYLNAFGQFMMPISDIPQEHKWAPATSAWNIRYNTRYKKDKTESYSGIAMHSTNSPDSIKKPGAGSHGCMRMNNTVANRLAAFLKKYVPARDDVKLSEKGVMELPELGRGLGILPFDKEYVPKVKIKDGPAPMFLQD